MKKAKLPKQAEQVAGGKKKSVTTSGPSDGKLVLTPRERAWKSDREDGYIASLKPLTEATKRLYFHSMRKFDAQCQQEGLPLENFIRQAVKSTKSKLPSSKHRPPLYHIYYLLNVKAENVVRKKYYLKTVQDNFFYDHYNEALERLLGDPFRKILEEEDSKTAPLSESFNNTLNKLFVNRWNDYFSDVEQSITQENWKEKLAFVLHLPLPAGTIGGAHKLYFNAAKHFNTYDPLTAVQLYLRYLFADLEDVKTKQFNRLKKTYGDFFTTPKQLDTFVQIATTLLEEGDLEAALAASETIFNKKFTTVHLDQSTIDEVAGRHAQTVQVLNKYLDEEEQQPAQVSQSQSNLLDPVQLELLALIGENNFTITNDELSRFAKQKGVLKNKLIQSINDACYETIDDILIEASAEGYEMLEKYYQKIIK